MWSAEISFVAFSSFVKFCVWFAAYRECCARVFAEWISWKSSMSRARNLSSLIRVNLIEIKLRSIARLDLSDVTTTLTFALRFPEFDWSCIMWSAGISFAAFVAFCVIPGGLLRVLRDVFAEYISWKSNASRARSLSSLIRVNLIEIKLRLARSRYRESLDFDRLRGVHWHDSIILIIRFSWSMDE